MPLFGLQIVYVLDGIFVIAEQIIASPTARGIEGRLHFVVDRFYGLFSFLTHYLQFLVDLPPQLLVLLPQPRVVVFCVFLVFIVFPPCVIIM